MRIALDVMGGDHGPDEKVQGAFRYLEESNPEDEVVLVGDQAQIEEQLSLITEQYHKRLPIVHAPDNIEMNDVPTDALRKKKNSSMVVGLNLHKDGEVQAFVSAGNTGAQMAGSLITLKRIPGVSRPAIGSFLPGENGVVFVIDVGANVDSKPHHLLQFGLMGNIFVSEVFNEKDLTVGLLNIGEEEKKGNEATIAAYQLLKNRMENFHGNIEGRDILKGKTDIVVCDGFVGNVMLKMVESVMGVLTKGFKKNIGSNLFTNLGAFLVKPAFSELKRSYDYEEYGGLPLLGVNGISIICHGSSGAKAIKNAIKVAKNMESKQVNILIGDKLKKEDIQSDS